jgi:hypothetical protein
VGSNIASVQKPLDLHAPFPDAVGFVPVKLSIAYRTIGKANPGHTLELAPATSTILPPKSLDLPDPEPDGHDLDGLDLSYDLEIHDLIVR